MGETTKIAWTTHSWSPWIGCTEVSLGCDHCYARELDRRYQYGVPKEHRARGVAPHWGSGAHRYRTLQWKLPKRWNVEAAKAGERRFIFPSLCDPFDNEVPQAWRDDLWQLIYETPALIWLLLSKRIGNAAKMTAFEGESWPNVWLGTSVVNQEEADRDIPKLLATPAAKRFVSYEPALGPADFAQYLDIAWSPTLRRYKPLNGHGGKKVDWIIVGGESGPKARPFDVERAYSVVHQCRAADVAPFVKQLGSFCIDRNDAGFVGDGDDRWPAGTDDKLEDDPFGYVEQYQGASVRIRFKDRAGADPAEWPEDLRVQEFPA